MCFGIFNGLYYFLSYFECYDYVICSLNGITERMMNNERKADVLFDTETDYTWISTFI